MLCSLHMDQILAVEFKLALEGMTDIDGEKNNLEPIYIQLVGRLLAVSDKRWVSE